KALPKCEIAWAGGITRPADDADLQAAAWVLSAGGSVQVDDENKEIRSAQALPNKPFRVTEIHLTERAKDADLSAVAGCKNLTTAYLVGTGITNEGLAHLKECKYLTTLNLSGTKVDDKSVAVIWEFKKLTDLSVGETGITEK